jgi:hypothetical protein
VGTVFWDAKGCILVDFLPRNKINAVLYVQMHQKLQHALCDKRLMKLHTILQHNNAHLTLGIMGKFG